MSNVVIINRNGILRVAKIKKKGRTLLHLDVANMRSDTTRKLKDAEGIDNFIEVPVLIERNALNQLLADDNIELDVEVDIA